MQRVVRTWEINEGQSLRDLRRRRQPWRGDHLSALRARARAPRTVAPTDRVALLLGVLVPVGDVVACDDAVLVADAGTDLVGVDVPVKLLVRLAVPVAVRVRLAVPVVVLHTM